jgi:hypothetical protein
LARVGGPSNNPFVLYFTLLIIWIEVEVDLPLTCGPL